MEAEAQAWSTNGGIDDALSEAPVESIDGEPGAAEHRLTVLAGYRSRLVGVALAIGLDRVRAEDVVHDVIIRVGGSAARLEDDELPFFAAKAVRNAAVNMHRDAARRARISGHAALQPDYHERFEDRVLAQIMVSDLLGSIAKIETTATVEMLVLWAVGYTHSEIADVYGLTEPAVQSRLHRALKRKRSVARLR